MADRRQRKGDHAGSAGRVVPGDPRRWGANLVEGRPFRAFKAVFHHFGWRLAPIASGGGGDFPQSLDEAPRNCLSRKT